MITATEFGCKDLQNLRFPKWNAENGKLQGGGSSTYAHVMSKLHHLVRATSASKNTVCLGHMRQLEPGAAVGREFMSPASYVRLAQPTSIPNSKPGRMPY
ncbi:hypothetical protein TWF569_008084 [Orbilia oligospora]|uniref:Uncharacterized protein n=1 Tax=Orbilia oligospora TaxID=2813651 RepID=A0A7C8MXK4_ORBOL|nr:hypothetical protein TWF102_003825 [Orbilia oligospora]KAF3092241.1 hypothetical protein TWF706_009085 [Orbilia oligospora]KAF3096953.1 hypothetical protein TWF103_009720 [Orbilia oligospora]KAF3136297.1 hypothetical protein TWF594_007937 [Orbilia oligospora]KAF3141201.1 hypothetical protein TWF569_008084 [Orbilia oligospora]